MCVHEFCPRVPWQVYTHVYGGQRSILGVFLIGLCARVSVVVKAHYDCGNFYKGNHVIGVAWFRIRRIRKYVLV